MIFYQQKQSGFSLVETLVAISILLIVIVGPMTISMQSAKSASFASEQVQAFFLAQEGLELAQKARDDLSLAGTLFGGPETEPWDKFYESTSPGIYLTCHITTGCGLSWSASPSSDLATVVNCADNPDSCKLHLKDSDQNERSRFSHNDDSTTPTPFTRKVYFDNSTIGTVHVRSVVTWRTGSLVAEQKVEVDTYLYNIYGTQ